MRRCLPAGIFYTKIAGAQNRIRIFHRGGAEVAEIFLTADEPSFAHSTGSPPASSGLRRGRRELTRIKKRKARSGKGRGTFGLITEKLCTPCGVCCANSTVFYASDCAFFLCVLRDLRVQNPSEVAEDGCLTNRDVHTQAIAAQKS